MKITINQKIIELPDDCDLAQALIIYGIQEKSYAVSVNQMVIARSGYRQTTLQPEDEIDILIPMQGG